jgi:N-formylglutamate amidohydrolase
MVTIILRVKHGVQMIVNRDLHVDEAERWKVKIFSAPDGISVSGIAKEMATAIQPAQKT